MQVYLYIPGRERASEFLSARAESARLPFSRFLGIYQFARLLTLYIGVRVVERGSPSCPPGQPHASSPRFKPRLRVI